MVNKSIEAMIERLNLTWELLYTGRWTLCKDLYVRERGIDCFYYLPSGSLVIAITLNTRGVLERYCINWYPMYSSKILRCEPNDLATCEQQCYDLILT